MMMSKALMPRDCKSLSINLYFRVHSLKRELLIDIHLNKELVRNYELAARRLEGILMQKLDPDKLRDFEKVLKEEVKDFLS